MREDGGDLAPLALARPVAAPEPPSVEASLSLDVRWLKPFRSFEATLATLPSASVAWFVEHEEGDAEATSTTRGIFVHKAAIADHHGAPRTRTHADVPDLAPDGRARALRAEIPGRFTLDAEGARLVLNVWPGAPAGPTQAFLARGEGAALRFEPRELDAAPGARILLWNEAGRSVDVRETGFAAYVPLEGARGPLTPIDEGLYRLHALVRAEDGARGLASETFLVDFERPAERIAIGPLRGEFSHPELARDVRGTFTAHHELRALDLWFNATSGAPAPASVIVTLLREGEVVASASTLASSSLSFADAPPGEYAIEVQPEHGALVRFDLTGEGVYRLPDPPRLRVASTT